MLGSCWLSIVGSTRCKLLGSAAPALVPLAAVHTEVQGRFLGSSSRHGDTHLWIISEC